MQTTTIRFHILRILIHTTGHCFAFAEKPHIDMILLETVLTIHMTLIVHCTTLSTEEKEEMTHGTATHSLHFLHFLHSLLHPHPITKKKLQFWCQDIHFQGLSSQCLMFSSDNLITNSIGSTTFGEWNHGGSIASSFFYVYLSFIPQTHTSTQLGFILPQSIQFIFLFLLQNYFLFINSSSFLYLTIFTTVITYLNLLHYTLLSLWTLLLSIGKWNVLVYSESDFSTWLHLTTKQYISL